ncbi:MAG: hypothetical protein MUE40_19035 [Anaerolineae bacterium]|nr:hypothetical protein [Anaerolineae bacterium]
MNPAACSTRPPAPDAEIAGFLHAYRDRLSQICVRLYLLQRVAGEAHQEALLRLQLDVLALGTLRPDDAD